MKSVCQFCGNSKLIKWGVRRRKCSSCKRTFRVQKSGRKPTKLSEMYILDRSTIRRIAHKQKQSPPEILRKLMSELTNIPPLLSLTKKFSTVQ